MNKGSNLKTATVTDALVTDIRKLLINIGRCRNGIHVIA